MQNIYIKSFLLLLELCTLNKESDDIKMGALLFKKSRSKSGGMESRNFSLLTEKYVVQYKNP